eukprot:TRINITY_DN5292_c3_g1_i1.p1 TRINITY_DN5292_c3_g1~~TRINITY_DN5292_c3_g1_i1.p1  ORF type:complete len:509 (+),score=136.17 TRINITY_DN5292_c3_g1_i1:55-1581(+)
MGYESDDNSDARRPLATNEGTGWENKGGSEGSVMMSFMTMTLCFALNHGTVTAVIPLATAQFGEHLGDFSLGTLYIFYTLTALLGSTVIVERLKHKWALVMGCAVYSLYVGGMFLGVLTHDATRWVVVLVGSAFGGIAAGFLWTAQGGYFANAAKIHARYNGIAVQQANSYLGGIFATVYLALELVMKLLSSLILVWVCGDHWEGDIITGSCGSDDSSSGSAGLTPSDNASSSDSFDADHLKFEGVVWTYAVFSVIAVASAVGMAFIRTVKPFEEATGAPVVVEKKPWYRKALVATELAMSQPKIFFVGIINVAFGFASAYLNSYVTGTVIKDGLGKDKIGYFVSIIPLVATVMSMPLSKVTEMTGSKTPAMLFGMACFLTFGMVFLMTDLTTSSVSDTLGKWGTLIPIFICFGCARAVWEGPNKAVIADMFKNDSEAAFANLILQLGTTSSIAFISFRFLNSLTKEFIVVSTSTLAIFGYIIAMRMHKADQSRLLEEIDEDEEAHAE